MVFVGVPYCSFLLEEETHCSMVINGEECITLAHGIENDPVASHTYYGSRAVAEDIEAMVADAHGCVELHQAQGCALRDEVTGLVCKLVQRQGRLSPSCCPQPIRRIQPKLNSAKINFLTTFVYFLGLGPCCEPG